MPTRAARVRGSIRYGPGPVQMSWLESVVLGLVQGLTEFLPVSSSAHLRFTSAFFFGHDAGSAFTAVSQLGTEIAVLIYFWPDIKRLVLAWVRGLRDERARGYDYRLAWYVGLGSLPIGVAGLLFQDLIDGPARNLALNASVLIVFGLAASVPLIVAGSRSHASRNRRLSCAVISPSVMDWNFLT